jgi:hypothetical protein
MYMHSSNMDRYKYAVVVVKALYLDLGNITPITQNALDFEESLSKSLLNSIKEAPLISHACLYIWKPRTFDWLNTIWVIGYRP